MEDFEIVKYISETGFAILVSLFLLIRMEKRMETLTASINELAASINKITE